MTKFKVGDKVKVIISKDDAWYTTFKNGVMVGMVSFVFEDGTVEIDEDAEVTENRIIPRSGVYFPKTRIYFRQIDAVGSRTASSIELLKDVK